MADDPEATPVEEEVVPEAPEQEPVEEQVPSQEDATTKSWQGRVKKVADVANSLLAAQGYTITEDGQVLWNGNAPVQQQTTAPQFLPQPEAEVEEEYNPYDKAQLTREASKIADDKINKLMGIVGPLLENLTTANMGTRYDDWKDIGSDVTTRLAQKYGITLAQAQASYPELLEDVIYSSRARKQSAAPVPPVPVPATTQQADTDRQELLDSVASVGTTPGKSPPMKVTDPDIIEQARNAGMKPAEYLELLVNPVVIDVIRKEEQ